MDALEDKVRYSRSARDIYRMYKNNPTIVSRILNNRGIEESAFKSVETLEIALDAERRRLIHANEYRLECYAAAAGRWAENWKEVEKETIGLSLLEAHRVVIKRAMDILPCTIETRE